MNLRKNKRGFIQDTILMSAALVAIALTIAVVMLILFNFNEKIQNSAIVGDEAKAASAYAEGTYGTLLGYGFMAAFIGFTMYLIITSVLINNIHPIFWIIGFVILIASTLITTTIKLIYGRLESVAMISVYLGSIPGAQWFFHGIEVINILLMGMQLTILYFTWER